MPTLLEIKRQAMDWQTIIFPTDSLPADGIDLEHLERIIDLICQEMSQYLPGELFMPHEVADIVVGSLSEEDFNSYEWEEIKISTYDIVITFCDILFRRLVSHSNVSLASIDETSIKISIQTSPTENF